MIFSRQAPALTAQVSNSVSRPDPTPVPARFGENGESCQLCHGRVDLEHPVELAGREPDWGLVDSHPSLVVGMVEQPGDPLDGAIVVGAPLQQLELSAWD